MDFVQLTTFLISLLVNQCCKRLGPGDLRAFCPRNVWVPYDKVSLSGDGEGMRGCVDKGTLFRSGKLMDIKSLLRNPLVRRRQ